jgi:hypothetical protein
MMEAFQRAVADAGRDEQRPRVDERTLRLLQAVAAPDPGLGSLSDAERDRLGFRARKLGRGWASHTHAPAPSPRELAVLRDEWSVLAMRLRAASHAQRVQVLAAFVEGLGLDDARHSGAKRAYLLRQFTVRPIVRIGFHGSAAAGRFTPIAYVAHALEELTEAPADERESLHAVVNEAEARGTGNWEDWLLPVLSCWLVTRGEAEWLERCRKEAA